MPLVIEDPSVTFTELRDSTRQEYERRFNEQLGTLHVLKDEREVTGRVSTRVDAEQACSGTDRCGLSGSGSVARALASAPAAL